MKYIDKKGITGEGFNRIAKALNLNDKGPKKARKRRKFASDVEELARMLKGVVLLKESVGGNYSDFGGDLDMGEPVVHVAIVHDGGGYTPGAGLYFSHSSPDEALQEAFQHLETSTIEQLSPEEVSEMYQTEETEGYNPVTETFDGRVFSVTPEEFKKVIEGVTGINKNELSVITFEYPEEDDDEDFEMEASRKALRRRKAQEDEIKALVSLIEEETGERVEVDSDGDIFVYDSDMDDFEHLSGEDLEFYKDKLKGVDWVFPSGTPYRVHDKKDRKARKRRRAQGLKKRAYTLNLSDEEMDSLGFIADRYSYADVLWNALDPIDEEGNYNLSESDAWAFAEAVEQEDGYLPLMGGALVDKVQKLLDSIV